MTLTAVQYQREIDDASDAEIALAERRVAVADDLYDAYYKSRPDVVAEIDQMLIEHAETLLMDLRDDEWRKTGKAVSRLNKLVSDVADEFVKDADDRRLDEIEGWM